MDLDQAYDLFLSELYNRAVKAFDQSDIGQMLYEQGQKMNDDIETNLSAREKEFTYSCLEQMLTSCGREAEFVYRQGLRDGVAMLKRLGAIS